MATRTLFMPSGKLKEKIKDFEGCKLTAYQDSKGVWTVGFGHTKGVKEGMKITMQQAELFLAQDLSDVVSYVNKQNVCKTQGQFDSLVDFAFNLGTGSLGRSTLLKYCKNPPKTKKVWRNGRWVTLTSTMQIQDEFRRWVFCGKNKLPGLIRRREWEAQRWAE